jgi:GNAT superfamily N-acetyltransferase
MGVEATTNTRILLLEPLDSDNAEVASNLAALHARCLPHSALSLLGRKGCAMAYRFLCRSKSEKVFAAIDSENRVRGGAVVSFAPTTLGRRLAFFPWLAPSLTIGLRRMLWRFVRSGPPRIDGASPAVSPRTPELLSIFVADSERRSGLGRRLASACIEIVVNEGNNSLIVHAPFGSMEALNFYHALGFQEVGPTVVRGQKLRMLTLNVSVPKSRKNELDQRPISG